MRAPFFVICLGLFAGMACPPGPLSSFHGTAWASDNNQEDPATKPNTLKKTPTVKPPATKKEAKATKPAKKPAGKKIKNTRKPPPDKLALYARTVKKQLEKNAKFYINKRRMRRLYERTYEAESKGSRRLRYTLLTRGIRKIYVKQPDGSRRLKFKYEGANDLWKGYKIYRAYKRKHISFATYKARMIRLFGFYP